MQEDGIIRRIKYHVARPWWPAVARVIWWDFVERCSRRGGRKYPKGLNTLLLTVGRPFRAGQSTTLREIEMGLRQFGYDRHRARRRVWRRGGARRISAR